ncbi:unnamed protein product [Protopolystoma xenopodis]|uniref:Uncharacterized protein n=1 Tax=Protopolystoma xenopodis TaxID=117903 RepID=A0A3S5FF52_9PLAT|nr:unnamed protein product [Protopolystoma xenopodis]
MLSELHVLAYPISCDRPSFVPTLACDHLFGRPSLFFVLPNRFQDFSRCLSRLPLELRAQLTNIEFVNNGAGIKNPIAANPKLERELLNQKYGKSNLLIATVY